MLWCPACNYGHVIDVALAFNGDNDAPTFSPSVMVRSKEQHVSAERVKGPVLQTVCHFSVKDGEISYFNDSTHALAGQTVALPDEFTESGADNG